MYLVKDFSFVGYDAFFSQIMPEIYALINECGEEDALDEFVNALTEAVCNAAIYAVDGMDAAKIFMNFIIADEQVKVTVSSKSKNFDVSSFRKKLMKIAVGKDGELDWQDYVGDSQQGRGIWLMLSFFDAVCIAIDGSEVTLITRLPLRCTQVNTVKKIVHKFFIVRNGVIT